MVNICSSVKWWENWCFTFPFLIFIPNPKGSALCLVLIALQNFNLEIIWAFGQKTGIIPSELACLMQWNTCPRKILQGSLPGSTPGQVILVSTEEKVGDSLTHGDSHENVFEILGHIRKKIIFVKIVEKTLWLRLDLTCVVWQLSLTQTLTHTPPVDREEN